MLKENKVVLGLSGGVDSATACIELQSRGYEVVGYYFNVLKDNEAAKTDARLVAKQLGIELITEDVSDEFENVVIANFIDEYMHGRTPNPCIVCNPNIKFKKLIEVADLVNAKYIATGHYCNIEEINGTYYVKNAANAKKDQTYMLYRLPQTVLSRLIFPLGGFISKDDTRSLAREKNLVNAEKADSQEICFVDPSESYIDYIEGLGHISPAGNFVDKSGNVIGPHKGILHYTIGQRKGLGIALGKPAFVTRIDADTQEVEIGDNEDLMTLSCSSKDNVFTAGDMMAWDGKEVLAKVRYSAKPTPCKLSISGDIITAVFTEKQRAVTPGQSIVFYDNGRVIGGGFII